MKRSTRGPALATLIATLFAAAVAATLAAAGLVLDYALGRQIADQEEQELVGKVQQVRHLLRERSSFDDIRRNAHVFRDVPIGHGNLYFRLWEGPGRPLVTAGPALPFASEIAIGPTDEPRLQDVRSLKLPGIGRLHILSARGALGDAAATSALIVLGRPVGAVSPLQRRYRATLIPAVALAATVAGALGFVAVWWSLRPLTALVKTSARLTAHRLGERLDGQHGTREVRELSAALNMLMRRLEESFARLSRFSADLAHDLKTPLATLMVQTQVALAQPRSGEEYRALLASNAEELDRLSRMIESMLFLARAEHAQLAVHLQLIDARRELARIADYFEGLADQAGVAIAVTGAGRTRADPALLRRAVANLVDNAIRHARPRSTVRLDVSEQDSAAVITVTNDGAGIAAEDVPRIFDRFYRADGVRRDSASSVGLGLAIVRSIMDIHGGTVDVRSVPDGKTEFRLVFPRNPHGSATYASEPGAEWGSHAQSGGVG